MRRLFVFGILLISALFLSYYLTVAPVKGDTFTAILLRKKPVSVQNAVVLAWEG